MPFTLNGFPYGDFHQDVVKHQVYFPTWAQPARTDYTRDLIAILHRLLPEGKEGSISTLPIAWGSPEPKFDELHQAAAALAKVAEHLAEFERSTGRLIHIDIEPEPGCILQRLGDVVRFFENYLLLPGRDEAVIRRYLRVCHDVCHAAVMFEEQADVLNRYRSAGIEVGKVQVSSAVALDLDELPASERAQALQQLAEFNEPRYLHQTMIRLDPEVPPVFFEDLHLALASPGAGGAGFVAGAFSRADLRGCIRPASCDPAGDSGMRRAGPGQKYGAALRSGDVCVGRAARGAPTAGFVRGNRGGDELVSSATRGCIEQGGVMIRAILKKGKIHPLEKLPADWQEGQELIVEGSAPSDDPAVIKKWYKKLEALSAKIPAADHERFAAALARAIKTRKKWCAGRWGSTDACVFTRYEPSWIGRESRFGRAPAYRGSAPSRHSARNVLACPV